MIRRLTLIGLKIMYTYFGQYMTLHAPLIITIIKL